MKDNYFPKMKHTFIFSLLVIALMFSAARVKAEENRQISVFGNHIEAMATQEGISMEEATKMVVEMGYKGVDVFVGVNPETLAIYDKAGLKHSCCIAIVDLTVEDHPEVAEQIVEFMKTNKFDKLMLVPGFISEDITKPELKVIYKRIARFAHMIEVEGFKVMAEDYDDVHSLCYDRKALDRMFKEVPSLYHTFDTGNYAFSGDDIMKAAKHFSRRIIHTHLKDHRTQYSRDRIAVGEGFVPMKELIHYLLGRGYKGWFTIECFSVEDMKQSLQTSITTISNAIDEYYTK